VGRAAGAWTSPGPELRGQDAETYEQSNPGGYLKEDAACRPAILWSQLRGTADASGRSRAHDPGGMDGRFPCSSGRGRLSEAGHGGQHERRARHGENWIGHWQTRPASTWARSTNSVGGRPAATNGDKQGVAISIACLPEQWKRGVGRGLHGGAHHQPGGGGCVGVMMNSRYGWGALDAGSNYVPGPSDRIDTTFFYSSLRGGTIPAGPDAGGREETPGCRMPTRRIKYGHDRWCIYELNLFRRTRPCRFLTSDPGGRWTVKPPGGRQLTGANNFHGSPSPTRPRRRCGARWCA